MKDSKQTEIELWYCILWDELRIINKLHPKEPQQFRNYLLDKWLVSNYRNKDGIPGGDTFQLYQKIGEL